MRIIAVGLYASVLMAAAEASPVTEEARQSFDSAFFDRFAPQTARDMLSQVPGFSTRSTGGGRGLGQGGTNVLINGERVTSKDTGVLEILGQTPAKAVIRIEVTDAAALGVTGLSGQVANVIIDRSSVSGSFEWAALFRNGASPRLTNGSVSVSGRAAGIDYTIGLSNESWRGFEEGPEQRLAADRTILDERAEVLNTRIEAPSLTAALNTDLNEKTTLALSGSATSYVFDGREISEGLGDTLINFNSEDEWNADLSAELAHEFNWSTLRLIGYQRYEHSPFLSERVQTGPGFDGDPSFFQSTIDEGETIGRAELSFVRPGDVTWELAVETAFNFLEDQSLLFSGMGDERTEEAFPVTRVEEIRHQASVTRGFKLGEKLAVQASLASEYSVITVESEGASSEQSFFRPRGFVTLAYPVNDRLDIRGRIERAVGQLSFGAFTASVDLTEDREQAGNTSLKPQQSWRGEVEVEKRFGADEKILVRVVGNLIEDRVDRVLINGIDAVGNIDEAQSISFETEGTILTDRWSVRGGRLDFGYSRFGSQLDDGVTGETRGFNGAEDWSYRLDFRQDIPDTDIAWGVGARANDDSVIVRFDEILRRSQATPNYSAFVEHKDLLGLNWRFSGRNLSNRDFDITRVRFAGIRDEAPIDVIEERTRVDNRFWNLTVSGTF